MKLSNNTVAATLILQQVISASNRNPRCRLGIKTKVRTRRTIVDVYNDLGSKLFRRAFRMNIETFFKLHDLLEVDIKKVLNQYTVQRQSTKWQNTYNSSFGLCN